MRGIGHRNRWKKNKRTGKVVSAGSIAHRYLQYVDETEIAANANQGSLYLLYTNDGSKLLPRPISICEIDKKKKTPSGLSCTGEKTGTEEFSQMKAGDTIW